MPQPSRRAKKSRLTLRAFAKTLGVSHTAVEKGVDSGRLKESVGWDRGRPHIKNASLARKEWKDGASRPPPTTSASAPAGNGKDKGPTLSEAQRQVALERVVALRLANRKKDGELILGSEARREAFECARAVRDSVLNVADRLAGELAAESDTVRVHTRLDAELRKALELAAEVIAPGE